MDASTQQLITRPLDSIDTFRALLQGARPDWMDANERLSTHSTDFSVNGVSLHAMCTRPIDLVKLNNMLTAECKVQMPEPVEWTQKLTIHMNDLQFPMDTCFPSHNGTLHGPQINIRLPNMKEAYCDISTSPTNFLIIAVPSADTIRAVTARVVNMLTLHRARLEESGVNVINLLDPARRQGLVDPRLFHAARYTGRQQIIEPGIEISSYRSRLLLNLVLHRTLSYAYPAVISSNKSRSTVLC